MSILLNIDTAIDIAQVSIAKDGEIIETIFNSEQKDHGGFLQPAIKTLIKNTAITFSKLDAIAISAGPGSYTGLRVGMASAKGLCYALNIPLITIGTLEIAAFSAILETMNAPAAASSLYCPMIDARRMEVYTALYDNMLNPVLVPCAMVLDQNSFANSLLKNNIFFFGNGTKKWNRICSHPNASFLSDFSNPLAMSKLACKKYVCNDFADVAYCEPFYIKEFFDGIPKN